MSKSVRLYFGGCKGIKHPRDANGRLIKVGDKLSWDFHERLANGDSVEEWMRDAIFVVEEHRSGNGLCARGIHKGLYLHDFRFRHCEVVD